MPKQVSSVEEYFGEIDSAGESFFYYLQNVKKIADDKLIIVEYFTTWCKRCPMTMSWLEELEQEYEDTVVLTVS